MAFPPGVVAVTLCAPAVPAGVTAVMEVELTTTTLVAAAPPTVTLLAPDKLVPVIVNAVPPDVGPLVGAMLVMVGTGATYVNVIVCVDDPLLVVTTTGFAPAVLLEGVLAVMEVALVTTTLVAGTPPMVTVVSPTAKLDPVRVIVVAPFMEPDVGAIEVRVGPGLT